MRLEHLSNFESFENVRSSNVVKFELRHIPMNKYCVLYMSFSTSDLFVETSRAAVSECNGNSEENKIVVITVVSSVTNHIYTVFQKKTPTHIIGYKLRSSCLILIIFDIKIPHII